MFWGGWHRAGFSVRDIEQAPARSFLYVGGVDASA